MVMLLCDRRCMDRAHLGDMLVEQWSRAKLGQQVEECSTEGMNTTAVKHGQTLLIGQGQLLIANHKAEGGQSVRKSNNI